MAGLSYIRQGVAGLLLFVSGFLLALLMLSSSSVTDFTPSSQIWRIGQRQKYNRPLLNITLETSKNESSSEAEGIKSQFSADDQKTFHYNSSMALVKDSEDEFLKIRVLCWVMTSPKTLLSKAQHVKNTWAWRCDKTLFMSSVENRTFPSIGLNVSEGRNALWTKTKAAFKYIYEHHFDEADWFVKADDDTFLIVENLKYMLASYKPSDPIFFGHNFKRFTPQGYMSGGAGYVLSKEAVDRFINRALPDPNKCKQAGSGAEDVEMGKCLHNVKVVAGDSRDSLNRHRFMPFGLGSFLLKGSLPRKFWYWSYQKYPLHEGPECCSDYIITFHYVKPNDMYLLEFYTYHIRPASYHQNHYYVINGSKVKI